MTKVFVVGLDAASPHLIERWKDDLPNLNKIMKNGAFGILESSHPPSTIPAWLCFSTGKNPAKIGIFDFVKYTRDGEVRVVDSTSSNAKRIWDILSEEGKKVGVLNVPITYPPTPVNGFMITGVLTPLSKKDYTYPPELVGEMDKLLNGYETDAVVTSPRLMQGGEKAFLSEVQRMHDKRVKATKYLMKKFSWDFFMVVFRALDLIQHNFWHFMDENHPRHPMKRSNNLDKVIKNWYCKMDSSIGELLSYVDERTTTIIMSDHGAGPLYPVFCVNEWLRRKGFLSTKKTGGFKFYVRHYLTSSTKKVIQKYVPARFIAKILRLLPQFMLLEVSQRGQRRIEFKDIFANVDWKNTKAFALGGLLPNAHIFLNFSQSSKEYLKWKEILIHELEEFGRDENIDIKIYRKEDVYSGKYLDLAPDLSVHFKKDGLLCDVCGLNTRKIWLEQDHSGGHTMEGLLMMKGPEVKKGLRIKAKIVDLAPTILYLFDLAIPTGMDGRVLKDLSMCKHPVKFREEGERGRRYHIYGREDEEEIKKRLKALGYLWGA